MRVLTRHAAIVAAYAAFFCWIFAGPLLAGTYLIQSDLYEQYLPTFLAPITIWSSFEFSGFAAFADPQDAWAYLPSLLLRPFKAFTLLAVAAYVLGASFTYAYVYRLTRSHVASAFSGLAFALSEAMMERLAHFAGLHAIVWLPLILLAIEGILSGARIGVWMAAGAFALSQCFLAGHPQPALYAWYAAAAYAAVGGWRERASRRFFASIALMFVIGMLLTSVKLVPIMEASRLTAREETNFNQFAGHSNSPAQMLSVLFSSIDHEGREAPTYVGLSTLMLAVAGAFSARRNWRVAFWATAAVAGLLLGAGANTPLANVAYYVPGYSRFRVVARHLYFTAFGASILAGCALARAKTDAATRRQIAVGVAVVAGAVAIGAAILALWPNLVAYESRRPLPFPVWTAGVWMQFAIGVLSALLCLWIGRTHAPRVAIAALFALLVVDQFYAMTVGIGRLGIDTPTYPRVLMERPSVHAARLAADMAPLDQRVLAVSGTSMDPVVPGALARLWQIPIAGGYNPMLLERMNELARMGQSGGIFETVIGPDDRSLDVLAVKYILVKPGDAAKPETYESHGVEWDRRPLGLSIGRADCGHRYSRQTSVQLAGDVTVSAVALVTFLRCSEDVPAGAEAASVTVVGAQGAAHTAVLRAGMETAETGLFDPELRARAKHQPPANTFGNTSPLMYFTRIDLPHPMQATRLEFRAPGTGGWTTIHHATVIDAAGRSHPVAGVDSRLRDPRWREVRRFTTSRFTDRYGDEDAGGEEPVTVYENQRAMPRAWIVPEIVPLDDRDAAETFRVSQLPDGRRFDPRGIAIVDATAALQPMQLPPGSGTADVEQIDDGLIRVRVSNGGFLVLSEAWYPGWRVRIDGNPATLVRANLALQGVVVPPGAHVVEFELVPRSLWIGGALSALGAIGCLVVLLLGSRTSVKDARAPRNAAGAAAR